MIDPSFPFFERVSPDQWCKSIPICIHGDEGRGRHKAPVMVVGVQPVLPIGDFKTNMKGTLGQCLL